MSSLLTSKADAELIVRAVNSHEELVSVLKEVYDATPTTEKTSKMLKRVFDVLAKTEDK